MEEEEEEEEMGQMQDGEGEKHGQEICCAHGVNMRWMQRREVVMRLGYKAH